MSAYLVIAPKNIRKAIIKIPPPWRLRIIENLRKLETVPFLGAPMKGKLKDSGKLVIWPYRIIYKIDKPAKTIIIVEAGHSTAGLFYQKGVCL